MSKRSSKSAIPAGAKRLPHRVLREGEHTGHKHLATTTDVELYEAGGGLLFARMPSPARVVHEEHTKLFLPAGEKVIGAVREYDHFLEESRQVMD